MAEHLNKMEEQIAANETSINNKADINHEHSYTLAGVLLNSGTQELTNGTLKIIDNNGASNGFAIETPYNGITRVVETFVGDNGEAYFRLSEIDSGGTQNILNYIMLQSDATSLKKPLDISSGGTGAATAEAALTNLGAASTAWVTAQIQASIDATWEASY